MESVKIANTVSTLDVYKQNSQRLQLEAFKIDTYIAMLNNCADKCNLQFRETGIKATEGAEDVECFNTCFRKTHAVNRLISQ